MTYVNYSGKCVKTRKYQPKNLAQFLWQYIKTNVPFNKYVLLNHIYKLT